MPALTSRHTSARLAALSDRRTISSSTPLDTLAERRTPAVSTNVYLRAQAHMGRADGASAYGRRRWGGNA
eukprot:1578366-Prymnesium_polylepis.2